MVGNEMAGFEGMLAAGRARWGDIGITAADLASYAGATSLASSAMEHGADVVLACGCVRGVRSAINQLDRLIRESVPSFLRRIDRDPEFADDICQRVREKLLNGTPPGLATYAGSGPLLNWMRVTTVRLALDAKRQNTSLARRFSDTATDHLIADRAGADVEVLKARYGPRLLEAVSRALKALPRRERAVLRLYLLANLTIDDLGRMHSVHRSTVARWIGIAERSVFDAVKAEFRAQWGLATSDVTSLVRLIRSDLPISLDEAL
jgi:RNA polymerase sigma-70 factor